jgi:hypothetical protein
LDENHALSVFDMFGLCLSIEKRNQYNAGRDLVHTIIKYYINTTITVKFHEKQVSVDG